MTMLRTNSIISFNFRIEGATDTLFEGKIRVGPRTLTLPSGGTHKCDGTNNGANPSPGPASSGAIDVAGKLCGFDFDGTWASTFEDYFITTIGGVAQTNTQFWGVLENFQFTPTGGCQTQQAEGSDGLWAYDAFNKNYFLDVQPRDAVVAPGQTVVFNVRDGSTRVPVAGASFAGQTTDANGNVVFTAPATGGTYVYKATRSDSIRSPRVEIVVV